MEHGAGGRVKEAEVVVQEFKLRGEKTQDGMIRVQENVFQEYKTAIEPFLPAQEKDDVSIS